MVRPEIDRQNVMPFYLQTIKRDENGQSRIALCILKKLRYYSKLTSYLWVHVERV